MAGFGDHRFVMVRILKSVLALSPVVRAQLLLHNIITFQPSAKPYIPGTINFVFKRDFVSESEFTCWREGLTEVIGATVDVNETEMS